jgi:multidrug efflux system membrane fusion protein
MMREAMTTPSARNAEESRTNRTVSRARVRGAMHRGLLWLILLCLLTAGGLGYYLMQPKEPESPSSQQRPGGRRQGFDPSRPMPVTAVPARTADVSVYLKGLGSVTPIATVTVRTRIDGQLMKTLFREGQIVRAGDLLAEIDPRTYEAQLQQAEGQMARDQALLTNALIDLERYRVLYRQDSVAKQQLDTQEALVRQYQGTVKVDQAAIDTAKLQLIYCRITAPISGRLGLRQVDPGNIVRSGDANGLVVITQLQPIGVVFTIPEDSLPPVMRKLRAGEKLAVDAYDRADKVKLASGMLLTVDNQIDPATGTVKLKAQFANEEMSLFPNQFANVRMLLDVKRGATLVPGAAIQRGTPGTFVYVVKPDNTVTVRVVKPGPTQGDDVSIEAGLEPGEQVVVDGADKLREGAKVEPIGKEGKDAAPGRDGARKGGAGGNRKRQREDVPVSPPVPK